MELFTLLANPARIDAERVTVKLRKALEALHMKSDALELRIVPLSGGTGIVCDVAVGLRAETHLDAVRKHAASVLADEMIEAYEALFVIQCIQKELEADDRVGLQSIVDHCNRLISITSEHHENGSFLKRRVAKLAEAIEAYLREEPLLHIEGFWHFRTEAYREEIRDTVVYAIDEWTMEQQYQDFISLLKYFVYLQEAKTPVVHVIHRGNHDFTLLDDRMLPIDMKGLDQLVVEFIDKDFTHEDVIVSTLISLSPGKLFVHTHTQEQQIIKTIMTIFEGRAQYCVDCRVCPPLLEERKRK